MSFWHDAWKPLVAEVDNPLVGHVLWDTGDRAVHLRWITGIGVELRMFLDNSEWPCMIDNPTPAQLKQALLWMVWLAKDPVACGECGKPKPTLDMQERQVYPDTHCRMTGVYRGSCGWFWGNGVATQ